MVAATHPSRACSPAAGARAQQSRARSTARTSSRPCTPPWRTSAARAPSVVVEDVHWADQSSRDLLTLLFTRGFSAPVSLVASYRSDDLHRRHPLRATSRTGRGLPRCTAWTSRRSPTRTCVSWSAASVPESSGRQRCRPLSSAQKEMPSSPRSSRLPAPSGARAPPGDLSGSCSSGSSSSTPPASGSPASLRPPAAGSPPAARLRGRDPGGRAGRRDPGRGGAPCARPDRRGRLRVPPRPPRRDRLRRPAAGERVRAHEWCRGPRRRPSSARGPTWPGMLAAGDREQALDASVLAGDAQPWPSAGPRRRHYAQALELLSDDHPQTDSVTLRAAAAATAVGRTHKAVELLQDRLERQRRVGPRGEGRAAGSAGHDGAPHRAPSTPSPRPRRPWARGSR